MIAGLLKALGLISTIAVVVLGWSTYHRTTSVQWGNPGVAMEQTETNERINARAAANVLPVAIPSPGHNGPLAVDAYKNVQVLGHLSSGELTWMMVSITGWVAQKQGCSYCHAALKDAAGKTVVDSDGLPVADPNKLWSDEVYAKVVARRMLQMTWHVNSDWKAHVQATGVTCYTCHRGNPYLPTFGTTNLKGRCRAIWPAIRRAKIGHRMRPRSPHCQATRSGDFCPKKTAFA